MFALAPLAFSTANLQSLSKLTGDLKNGKPMPLLFLGHGSPMNAIEENRFVTGWRNAAASMDRPLAILCISAHWETRGTFVTAMEHPRTIHDFGGFPQALFDVQYPAPGSPQLAAETISTIHSTEVQNDYDWGLDHGAWSVVRQMYPDADIPIIQMSIDRTKPASYHYNLACELASLRKKGVLIIGSGNMVHNLRRIDWRNPDGGYDWAVEANERFKQLIVSENYDALINYQKQGEAFNLSIPTPEHFIPLLYILGLKNKNESISLFNDKTIMGSISMTSVKIG